MFIDHIQIVSIIIEVTKLIRKNSIFLSIEIRNDEERALRLQNIDVVIYVFILFCRFSYNQIKNYSEVEENVM